MLISEDLCPLCKYKYSTGVIGIELWLLILGVDLKYCSFVLLHVSLCLTSKAQDKGKHYY